MNTNEFYKELFEKYALDEDKIRLSAIKEAKTPAWKRAVGSHWKAAAGIAAAVAVTVGAVTYTAVNPPQDITITPSENMLSASQRLHEAERNYLAMSLEEDRVNVYVSFNTNVSYRDMSVALSSLSDSDDITAEAVYLTDGSVVSTDGIESFAEKRSSEKVISGAKLSAPSVCYRDIQDLSSVYLAELESAEINDETFEPIYLDDRDPLETDQNTPVTSAPAPVSTTSFVFDAGTAATEKAPATVSETTSETTVIADDPEYTGDDDVSDTGIELIDPDEIDDDTTLPVEEIDEEDPSDYITEVDEPDETTPAEISIPVTEVSDSGGIGLMTQIYQLSVENALDTVLIEDYAVVLKRDEVYLYRLGGVVSSGQAKICAVTSPKIAYSDKNTIIISGCGEKGLRNTFVVVDMKNDYVYSIDASANLGESEIGTINYSESENKFFLKTISASSTYFYEVTIDTDAGMKFRPLLEFTGAVMTAGYKDGTLWFAASEDNVSYTLYSFDCINGITRIVKGFESACNIRRSPSFDSFTVITTDPDTGSTVSYVFDASQAAFIDAKVNGEANIAVRNGSIYIGLGNDTYIMSSDGALTPTSIKVSFTKKTESDYVVMETSNDKIVIAQKNTGLWE